MNTDKRPSTLLFNPFVYIAGGKALVLGLLTILVAGFLGSLSTTHFDGVLDTHTGRPATLCSKALRLMSHITAIPSPSCLTNR